MKNLFLYTLLLLIPNALLSQTNYPTGTNGCVARWTFDAPEGGTLTTIVDASSNNNDGTNNFITSVPGWRSLPNKAGGFNGSTSWSEVQNNSNLNSNEITMICLAKMDSFNSALCQGNQFISKGYPYNISGNYGMGLGDNYYDGSCTVFSPNYTQLIGQNGAGAYSSTPTGNYISLNKWYFFAITINSNTIKHYQIEMDTLNKAMSASPIFSLSGVNNLGSNTQSISIGKHLNPQYPYWINGSIDELILFNRVLNDNEIYGIYEYLYGAPTSTNNYVSQNNYNVNNISNKLSVQTNSLNYQIKIYNLSGLLLTKKESCYKNESIYLGNYPPQLLIVEISDEKTILTKKILIH
ncbi:MAG: hypothetical protein JNJ58_04700 [Chitinophagaceae bacterium]|nr:hypothetical protein [Chitinophagaceae bacterium]